MVEARNKSTKSNKRSVKSKELRKYEVAYNKCIKMCLKSKRCKKSAKKVVNELISLDKSRKRRKSTLKSRKRSKSKSKRRLNAYQKFVKRESSKSIYKGKNVRSRMRAISKLWKKNK